MSSAFSAILERLVLGVPGLVGAVFADWDGEPVDQFSHAATDEIQIMGAQWGVTVGEINRALHRLGVGHTAELWLEGDRATAFVMPVTDKYFVVLFGKPEVNLGQVRHKLQSAVALLRSEM